MSPSPEHTQHLGCLLGAKLQAGDVVCLCGDLGAGKTTFAIGIGQGWGAENPVTSPTFVIVHQHRRAADVQMLYHLDAYRLDSAADVESIGLDDILDGNSAVIIEWADKIKDDLPPDALWIALDGDDSERRITLRAYGECSQMLLDELKDV